MGGLASPQPPSHRFPPPPVRDDRLDAPGQRRGQRASVWTRHREMKHGKSGGSVGTTKGKEREVEREKLGKEEEEGHRVVGGRWAPRPMEGKGPMEGQQIAIG